MRRRTTLIGAMLVKQGEADGMICGTVSTTAAHLRYIDQILGGTNEVYAAMNGWSCRAGRFSWSTPTSTLTRPLANWRRSP